MNVIKPQFQLAINKILYKLTASSKFSAPQLLGLEFYQKKASWPLRPEVCPCDLELVDYLKDNEIEGKTVFHFGTGTHHIVGTENQKLSNPNQVIGITACTPEHQAYMDLALSDRQLYKNYTVICKDIYTLTDNMLPQFDVVSLFHLAEFHFVEEAPFVHHDDTSLIEMFLRKLNDGGRLLFYRGSFAWDRAYPVLQNLEQQNKIEKVEEYKHLLVYNKKA
jgi:hypothetical protein